MAAFPQGLAGYTTDELLEMARILNDGVIPPEVLAAAEEGRRAAKVRPEIVGSSPSSGTPRVVVVRELNSAGGTETTEIVVGPDSTVRIDVRPLTA